VCNLRLKPHFNSASIQTISIGTSQTKLQPFFVSIMVSIPACQKAIRRSIQIAGDLGSIPRRRDQFFFVFLTPITLSATIAVLSPVQTACGQRWEAIAQQLMCSFVRFVSCCVLFEITLQGWIWDCYSNAAGRHRVGCCVNTKPLRRLNQRRVTTSE
jgi:hypothetical protein